MTHTTPGERNLRNHTYIGQNRQKEDFSGADLRGANFHNANLYKADFSGAKLRDANFHGANLRESNFTNVTVDTEPADEKNDIENTFPRINFRDTNIRGTDFSDATLTKADFTSAKSGLSKSWQTLSLAISIFFCLLSAFPTAIVTTFSLYFFRTSRKKLSLLDSLLVGFWSVVLAVLLRAGLIQLGAWAVNVHVGVGISMILMVLLGAIITMISSESDDDFSGVFLAIIAALVTLGYTMGFSSTLAPLEERLFHNLLGWIEVSPGEGFGAGVFGALLGAVFGCLFSRAAISENGQFSWLWQMYIRFMARGGTTFKGADLTEAIFSAADLRGANFRNATIKRINWQRARSLEFALTGNNYLKYSRVRQLVLGRSLKVKNFAGLDLEGINLEGEDLSKADFTEANLSQANLQKANLRKAMLQGAKVYGANLAKAKLTGACIYAWAFDESTVFKDIKCEYVFKQEYPDDMEGRRRVPSRGNKFKPGDFEKFIEKDRGTSEILIQSNDNKQALYNTIKQLSKDKNYAFKGYEAIGDDALIKVKISDDVSDGTAEDKFYKVYQSEVEDVNHQDTLKEMPLFNVILEAFEAGAKAGRRDVTIINGQYAEIVGDNNENKVENNE
ncbi:pentapeptide repeat-containing protein [Leptolyngbya cf. ectocarpi LEGE 11479]|uniref:Pentapeptide repeat-containing protein n=1 Tax=Leptolyngbya cf. ectocarpi LEGE 11479 TaxID=1828722 RepID=A0A928X1D2_LEPEC|nr:pentapeptide repeat-containing protein [Leptolyngbya ectocarpi]MBE9067194.1 pentapeptide repeat-containing protein [Leptolyngbya cf. ectocarpi LEGE 11479]